MREVALLEDLVSRARAGMELSRLLSAAGLPARAGGADPVVTGVTHDSGSARPGDVFVGVRGRRDGADFAADAVARGAVAVVAASPDRDLGVPWIVVEDDRGAVADLAAALHGHPSAKLMLFGVTGTNGKTTTVSACAEVLGAAGGHVGVIGTVETRWPGHAEPASRTTPEATDLQRWLAAMVDDGCAAAVIEVSSHGVDLERVRALQFAGVGFTNLSQDHLDWHGDMETYYQSKRKLFTEMAPGAPAVICVDDEWGARLARELREADSGRVVLAVGFSPAADLRIRDHQDSPSGARLTLALSAPPAAVAAGVEPALSLPLRLALAGEHNARNAAVAAGLALVTGAPAPLVIAGLEAARGVPGRLERVALEPGTSVDGIAVYVDYAHTPGALEGVLTAARGFTKGRLICVFGCGGDKDKAKRAPMGEAVGRLADIAIATSDNPRSEDPQAIVDAACAGLRGQGAEVHADVDRRAAIDKAIAMARPGDTVIIAGKGHETYQEIAGRRIPFDDRVVAHDALIRRAGK